MQIFPLALLTVLCVLLVAMLTVKVRNTIKFEQKLGNSIIGKTEEKGSVVSVTVGPSVYGTSKWACESSEERK